MSIVEPPSLREDLAAVVACMHQALAVDEPRVAKLIADLGAFHGKMLRPLLVLHVAQALGAVEPIHHQLAAALELIHTATLIHDDIIDGAQTRRGQPATHVRFGVTQAVLLGDYFYTHAFHLVSSLGRPELLQRLTAATNVVCKGELHQMCASHDTAVDEAEYDRIIYAKTAVLCELSCAFGAAGASDAVRASCAAYGLECGMAFQIVDDCLDLTGDVQKIGKTLATDLDNGRMTLPVIRYIAGNPALRAAQVADAQDPTALAALRRDMLASGALDAALDRARAHVARARQALARLPQGAARDALDRLAQFIVDRDH